VPKAEFAIAFREVDPPAPEEPTKGTRAKAAATRNSKEKICGQGD
jgi:hypothetical protein